jgi:hypothetical protein
VVLYGPAPIDASDARDAGRDSVGVLYGPVPVDS